MKKFLFLIASMALLVSCVQFPIFKGDGLQFMPFQASKDNRWGMISTSGEVLFTDEFKDEPTVAMHDRFFAKNSDGKWNLYSTEKNPTQVGKNDYEQAGAFLEDVAPVSVKGKPIQFIDKDANVKFELDKVDGKEVELCTNFSDGLAIFKVGDYYGCINTKGEVVIKPDYVFICPASDGKVLAVDKKYKDTKEKKDIKVTVLSAEGEKLKDLSFAEYSDMAQGFVDGKLCVEEEAANGQTRCGLIDAEGNTVVAPSDKIQDITGISGDNFTYENDDSEYGLKNVKGETLIRAKFKKLSFSGAEKLLFAMDDDGNVKLINENGDVVSRDSYEDAKSFHGAYAAVKENKDNWIFINKDGEDQKVKSDIYDIFDDYYGDDVIYRNGEAPEDESLDGLDLGDDDEAAEVDSLDSTYVDDEESVADNSLNDNSNGSYIMTGSVDKYPITMYMEFDGSSARGWYYYDKYQRKMTFSGSVNNDGTLDLYCEGGDRFNGTFTDGAYSGQFFGNNGNQFFFSVSQ